MAIYTYEGKRSWMSAFLEKYMLLRGTKKAFSTVENTSKFLERKGVENTQPYRIEGVTFTSDITESLFEGMQLFTLNNQNRIDQKVILYIHGGAWTNQPLTYHWRFMDQMAQELKAKIIAPIYPKVPHYNHTHSYPVLIRLYEEILKSVSAPTHVTIMGDSAGGNISLSLACQLKTHGLPQPKDIILISACVDMGLTHPEIPTYEAKDPMLSAGGMSVITRKWAGEKPLNDPIISPLYADITSIAKITHFIGTHEGLYPDAIKLDEMVAYQGGTIETYVYPKMNHVFVILPLKEAMDARHKIVGIINQ